MCRCFSTTSALNLRTPKPHLRRKQRFSYRNTDSWIQRLMEVTTRRIKRVWPVWVITLLPAVDSPPSDSSEARAEATLWCQRTLQWDGLLVRCLSDSVSELRQPVSTNVISAPVSVTLVEKLWRWSRQNARVWTDTTDASDAVKTLWPQPQKVCLLTSPLAHHVVYICRSG